jgi:hypothetical protein
MRAASELLTDGDRLGVACPLKLTWLDAGDETGFKALGSGMVGMAASVPEMKPLRNRWESEAG